MTKDFADYGVSEVSGVHPLLSDLGELAARLGSIVRYDRRGLVFLLDDFESPTLNWLASSNAGGTDPVLSSVSVWEGAQSVYLATAAEASTYAAIQRNFPLVRSGKIGIECTALLGIHTPGYLRARMLIYNGTNYLRAELRLDNEAGTATIVTPSGNIEVATNCFPPLLSNCFMPVKLVVDIDTGLYTRLIIGPTEYDLSAYSLVTVGAATDIVIIVQVYLQGDVVEVMSTYLDNFIYTNSEP